MPVEGVSVSRSPVTLSASVGRLTAGPSGVSRMEAGGEISFTRTTASGVIASGDNLGITGLIYQHQPPYGIDPYGPWMWQAMYLASALSISPFIFWGIWQAFGFLIRHTIIFGWLWICCFFISLIVACFLDGPAPAAIIQCNDQNLQLVRGPEGVNVVKPPGGCAYPQPGQRPNTSAVAPSRQVAAVQTSLALVKHNPVKGLLKQEEKSESHVQRKSRVQIQDIPNIQDQITHESSRNVRAVSVSLVKEAEMFRESLLVEATTIVMAERFIPMLNSSSAKFGADIKIVESMTPTVDLTPGPGNENEFRHVHL